MAISWLHIVVHIDQTETVGVQIEGVDFLVGFVVDLAAVENHL